MYTKALAAAFILVAQSPNVVAQNDGDTVAISFRYVDWKETTFFPRNCVNFSSREPDSQMRYVLRDDSLVARVRELVAALTPLTDASWRGIEARIVADIPATDGTVRRLCIGSFWGTMVGTDVMEDNAELFSLIRGVLYPDLK